MINFTWINPDGGVPGLQVRYVRTEIFNWFNVYHITTGRMVNLKPEQFKELNIGGLDSKMGCGEISLKQAKQLFGAAVA